MERQFFYLWRYLNQHTPNDILVYCLNLDLTDKYAALLMSLQIQVGGACPDWPRSKKIAHLIKTAQTWAPDLVHSCGFYTNTLASLLAVSVGAQALGSVRSDFVRDQTRAGILWGLCCAYWPRVQIYNSYHAQYNAQQVRLRPKEIVVIQNGIDTDYFYPPLNKIHSNANFRLLAVGSLLAVKRWDRLVDVVKKLHDLHIPVSVDLLGDGPLKESLIGMIQLHGLSEIIHLRGRQTNVREFLHQADVLVHTAQTEGCPNVILEAMACGLPVVSMRCGDAAEIIVQQETGILCEQEDIGAMTESLICLFKNKELRIQMGKNARLRIESSFSLGAFALKTLSVYDRIVHKDNKD